MPDYLISLPLLLVPLGEKDYNITDLYKSYAVNKSHIEKIDKSGRKILLKGFTDTIPIGNKYQAELWG